MSSWVTGPDGKWHPGKERVALKNLSGKVITIKQKDRDGKEFTQEIHPGEDYIYDGPDRAALYELYLIDKTGNTTTIGQDFRSNLEFMEYYGKYRNMFGFNSVEEFLTYLGWDEKKAKEDFDKKASVVKKHELPRRVDMINKLGGGKDTANSGLDKLGGFGDPDELASTKG
jgi:hypothetical protein